MTLQAWKSLSSLLPPLWCAGKLGVCPPDTKRFKFTCLSCRTRRRLYGKYVDPAFWITYTYKSSIHTEKLKKYVVDGVTYTASDGGFLNLQVWDTVRIDPRGFFTKIRCAAIIVLDRVMETVGYRKPLAQICEFLANYPT